MPRIASLMEIESLPPISVALTLMEVNATDIGGFRVAVCRLPDARVWRWPSSTLSRVGYGADGFCHADRQAMRKEHLGVVLIEGALPKRLVLLAPWHAVT
jgi:hypothetical protein